MAVYQVYSDKQFGKKKLGEFLDSCRDGHESIVAHLLSCGASANKVDERGKAGLFYASVYGHHNIVATLINHGADVNITDECGHTALMCACEQGGESIVKLLVENGADVNVVNQEGTALFFASGGSWEGEPNENIVKMLIEHGAAASIDACSNTNIGSPLLAASYQGHVQIVKLLLELGADVCQHGSHNETALTRACAGGLNYEMAYDREGMTPEEEDNFAEIVELLLQHGADINSPDGSGGLTSAMMAVVAGQVKCLKKLLRADPNLDYVNKNRETVFTCAMVGNGSNYDCLTALLEDGRILSGGRLKPEHRPVKQIDIYEFDALMITIQFGVFEWILCNHEDWKEICEAAIELSVCPGIIPYRSQSLYFYDEHEHYSEITLSPLILSLLDTYKTVLAETFVENLYFFPEDIRMLTENDKLRGLIGNKKLLNDLTLQPMSLFNLSFLVVSKRISVGGLPCGRRQRVDSLDIPCMLKDMLTFKGAANPWDYLAESSSDYDFKSGSESE